MSSNLDAIGREGLRFYGKISASISHEMKNVLAILNENAGLLEDLILMSKRGVSLNVEKIESVAESMKKQIRRGDFIATNLNRFAHSVDDFFKTIETGETLALIVSVTRRFADMKGVTLNLRSDEEKVEILTYPFLLEHLLGCCLDMAISHPGKDKIIDIDFNKSEKELQIHFSGLREISVQPLEETFPGAREKALMDVLKAQVDWLFAEGKIRMTLPKEIET